MRILYKVMILICIITMLLPINAAAADIQYIRIVSSDPSEIAQARKMQARRLILPLMKNDHAYDAEVLAKLAQNRLEAAGYCVTADIRTWSPDRVHPPAATLYITIGQGQGRNWWGILCRESWQWTFLQRNEKSSVPSNAASQNITLEFPLIRKLFSLFRLGQ